jgi:hypothetical protein
MIDIIIKFYNDLKIHQASLNTQILICEFKRRGLWEDLKYESIREEFRKNQIILESLRKEREFLLKLMKDLEKNFEFLS